MKNFLQTFFACLLAIVAGSVVLSIMSFLMFAGILASLTAEQAVVVDSNSILKIELSENVVDNPESSSFGGLNPMTMKFDESLGLLSVINAIDKAADDDNIKGIYLNISPFFSVGMGTMEEIRSALVKFKESGKFIVSYADVYTQGSYYLSSVADKIYMNPAGGLDWRGMAMQTMFYKGLLEKTGVEVEIVRCGDFKSAVEGFMYDKMSPENRLQSEVLLGTIWGNLVSEVAKSRGLDSAAIQQYASELTLSTPQKAVDTKMVDELMYYDQMSTMLAEMSGQDDEPEFVTLANYIDYPVAAKNKKKLSKNKIAVVYAEGTIVFGDAKDGQIGASLAEKLAEQREDDDVKAVVFRVNSPGGSALTSEIIWREVSLLQKEKPVIVSMGNYAASGGYYIAAPADVILADRGTLTGSIGVFGMMPNGGKALKDKLGITVDVVKTNTSSDIGSIFRGWSDAERRFMQTSVDQVYDDFVGHVAEGRNLSREAVLAVASGRVWSGISAEGIGLIDGYGGITDAIALAADRAGVADDFRVVAAEGEQNPFAVLMKQLSKSVSALVRGNTPEMVREFMELEAVLNERGVQARMPFMELK